MNPGNPKQWRIENASHLRGVRFELRRYTRWSDNWDHDHCSACWAKLAEFDGPEIHHEGYATRHDHRLGAGYEWVCRRCFDELKDDMGWTAARYVAMSEGPREQRGEARLTETERRRLLDELMQVGPSKPVAYLPLFTVKGLLLRDPEGVAREAAASGLTAAEFGPDRCCIKSGALYVYHREALAELLQARAEALAANGLPTNPDHFIAFIASVWFEQDHPVYPIVVAAFGGRLEDEL